MRAAGAGDPQGGRGGASAAAAGAGDPPGAGGPVFLVRGDDPSLLSQASTSLVTRLVGDEDPALAVEDHSFEDEDLGPVLEACSTPPFLVGRRVVVAREAGRLRADAVNRLVRYLEDPLPTTSLVLVAGGGPLSSKLVAAARRSGHVVDASAPSGRGRAAWLAEQVAKGPVRLDRAAVSMLDRHLGEDLGRLEGILASLAAAHGEGARLGPAEVEPFLGESGGVPPWELTDAIDRGDVAVALTTLHRLLEGGQRHPLTVAATLNRHYGAMLSLDGSGVTDEGGAAEALGMSSPWRAGKIMTQGRRLGSDRLRRAISLLAKADLDLRGATALPGVAVMEVLVARLARLGGGRRRR